MKDFQSLAQRKGLYLIEDCAQGFGAKMHDSYCGTFGDLGAFSFHPLKTLCALGDAGAIITSDSTSLT